MKIYGTINFWTNAFNQENGAFHPKNRFQHTVFFSAHTPMRHWGENLWVARVRV